MRSVSILTSLLLLLASIAAFADAEQEGLQAAEEWLVLVDAGEYAQSWDESAGLFQTNVKKEDWVQALENLHTPLGTIESRDMDRSEFTTTLPGVPDGEYLVIKFKTSFENKGSATETVTVMKSEDGTWRAAGYFIQ